MRLMLIHTKSFESRVLCLILFLFSFTWANAQDIHYSQFNSAAVYQNPANTGLFEGDYRLAGNFRNQYKVVTVGYNSTTLSGDMRYKFKKHTIGLGAFIQNDRAGDSRYGGNKLSLSLSYIKKISKDSAHFIALGFQPGLANRGIQTANLTFDNQYNGDGFSSNIGPDENFANTNMIFADFSAGISWYMFRNKRNTIQSGIAYQHFNKPQKSFFNENPVAVSPKLNAHISLIKPISTYLDIIPEIQLSRQNKYNAINLGTWVKYWLGSSGTSDYAVYGGLFCRIGDAAIIAAAVDYENFRVGLSYDITFSQLKTANQLRGGAEVSVIYIFRKIPSLMIKSKNCPVWM
ncbi:MAG: PorP/SprF family type IX secretion system membrane protein [Bacteroidota bacterium]